MRFFSGPERHSDYLLFVAEYEPLQASSRQSAREGHAVHDQSSAAGRLPDGILQHRGRHQSAGPEWIVCADQLLQPVSSIR